jgi:hypothetical protein
MFRLSDKTTLNLRTIFQPFLVRGEWHEKLDTQGFTVHRGKFFVGFCGSLFSVFDRATVHDLPPKEADDRPFIRESFCHGLGTRVMEQSVIQIDAVQIFENLAEHRGCVNSIMFGCKRFNIEAVDREGKSVCHVGIIVIFSPT